MGDGATAIQQGGMMAKQFSVDIPEGKEFLEMAHRDGTTVIWWRDAVDPLAPWQPGDREEYSFFGANGTVNSTVWWNGAPSDASLRNFGNCFPTKEAAEHAALRIKAHLRLWDLAERLNAGKERGTDVYAPWRSSVSSETTAGSLWHTPAGAWFISKPDCERAIEILRSEGLLDALFQEVTP